MTSPARMAHIVFRANDISRMQDWYRNVLEATAMCSKPTLSSTTAKSHS